MVYGSNLLALTPATPLEEKPCVVTGKEPPPRTLVSSDDMCSDNSESRKTDALECMWLYLRKVMWLNVWYIPHIPHVQVETEYKGMRHATLETGGQENWRKEGGGGGASWTAQALFAWTRTHDEPKRSGRCGYIAAGVLRAALWCLIRAPRTCAVLDCWRHGIEMATVASPMPASVYSRDAQKRKVFNSFTFFSRWKWFISISRWARPL